MSGTLYASPEHHSYLRESRSDAYQRAILSAVYRAIGLQANDLVLEVGAGAGRYTGELLRSGFSVLATEPDDVLFDELSLKFGDSPVRFFKARVGQLPVAEGSIAAVCGFHILHHLGPPELEALAGEIARVSASPDFKGWFFLEPNPMNPLYMFHIAITPGMRFKEERGIWFNDYRAAFMKAGVEFQRLGEIGILPPQISARLPARVLARLTPRLSRHLGPFGTYRVYGGRAK